MFQETNIAHRSEINPLLKSIEKDVMGFLNEVQLNYPQAISFASGRPDENYFGIEHFSEYLNAYVESVALLENKDRQKVFNSLGQYNRTKGIINQQMVKYLEKDEGIHVGADDLLITVGTQEGLAIAVTTLCNKENDVIIVEDPTYVGITHFSLINGHCVVPVPIDINGISPDIIEEKIIHFQDHGKKVKIVYVIPDYQNPTGNTMPLKNRYRLLALADKYDFMIIEDNAYGDFSYNDNQLPTLKRLDNNKRVIYMKSFSKTLYPSLRLSVMVADQIIKENSTENRLSDLMAKTKGYITVNTPSVNQAVFAGILIKNDFSLQKSNQIKAANMKKKRDQILYCLKLFLDQANFPWAKGISWNHPDGGFFITVKVPFKVDESEVTSCARDYDLIFTPMSFFYFNGGGDNEIRLAFSNVSEEEIKTGIERLSNYFKHKILTY